MPPPIARLGDTYWVTAKAPPFGEARTDVTVPATRISPAGSKLAVVHTGDGSRWNSQPSPSRITAPLSAATLVTPPIRRHPKPGAVSSAPPVPASRVTIAIAIG